MKARSIQRKNLKLWQWRIVVLGWLTYASYYLGRVNLSIAIPDLRENLHLSSQEVGLFGSGFFFAYAFGQLISGHLGDRISPRKMVFGGMLLSVAKNLLFGSVDLWALMLVVWTVNGFFQSTGWAPILKVLANWHSPEQRRKVAGIYATSYVAGNAITWILAGWLVAGLSWRAAFWVPGALMGLVALAWYLLIRDTPQGAGFTDLMQFAEETDKTKLDENSKPNMLQGLRRFWPLVLAAVNGGMLLFALIIWAPTYFVDIHSLGIGTAATISIFFPIAVTIGTLAVSWLVAGLIDFAFNIGASLGGFLVGAVIDKFSWSAVFIVLALGAILTSVLLVGFAFWINKLSGKSILSLEQSVL